MIGKPEIRSLSERFMILDILTVEIVMLELTKETLIRPISARFMHTKEVEKYEQAFTKNEKR